MAKLYSQRNRKPNDLKYEPLPFVFRNQVINIWGRFYEAFSYTCSNNADSDWANVVYTLRTEYGRSLLTDDNLSQWVEAISAKDYRRKVEIFTRNGQNTDEILDAIELVFQKIAGRNFKNHFYSSAMAIEDLNRKFLENDLGYELREGCIIRIENQLLHQQSVGPALDLTTDSLFSNVNSEYLNALSHLRNQSYNEALVGCGKAWESAYKIIFTELGWEYPTNATASKLLTIAMDNDFFPVFMRNQLSGLKNSLEGLPTLRNKAAHGQGMEKSEVRKELAEYAVNITGATIKLMIDLFHTQS